MTKVSGWLRCCWQVSCKSFIRNQIGKIKFLTEKWILRKCVAGYAILLNTYGRRIDLMSQATNWTHKHHFIMQKMKKTYLTDYKNNQEKEQTDVFCELKTCFCLPLSG